MLLFALCARATCANHGWQRIPVLLRVLTSSNSSEEQVPMVSLPRKMRPAVGKVARNHLAVPGMQQRWPSREFRRYARPADGRIPCTSVAHMECEFSGVCVLGAVIPWMCWQPLSFELEMRIGCARAPGDAQPKEFLYSGR